LLSNYLFHILGTASFYAFVEANQRGASYPAIPDSVVKQFRVPVPSLEVQREVAEVLDQFTKLEAELEAELEARRKQYEYYRNSLLTFPESGGVPRVPMGEFAQLVRGNGMPKADFVDDGVPAIHYGQIYTHYGTWTTATMSYVTPSTASKLAKVDPGDIVITNTSENVEDVGKAVAWLGNEQAITGGHATVIKHHQNSKYLAYYFRTVEFDRDTRRYANGTKVVDVSAKSLAKIEVPLPSHDEQDRIVSVLDNFDALTNDLSVGLPAELAARRKQYEYYRDRLLTFEELAA
jgi:type I restriction enzyme S subunit